MKKFLHKQEVSLALFALLCLFMLPFTAKSQKHQTAKSINADKCTIETLPYVNNFTSYPTGASAVFPECLSRLPSTGTTAPYISTIANSDANSVYFSTTMSSSYSMLILPMINADISLLRASFAFRTNYTAIFEIGVMTDPTDVETFQAVETLKYSISQSFNKYTVYFDKYEESGKYIAFRWYQGMYASAYFDNLVVDYAPACKEVRDLTISNIAGRTALASWLPSLDNPSQYEVTVTDSLDAIAFSEIVTSTTCVIIGLETNTSYEIKVKALCDDDESPSINKSIKTAVRPECTTPNVVTCKKITSHSAVVSWAEDGISTNYAIEYSEANSTNWIQDGIVGQSKRVEYLLTNLTPNTEYTVRISSVCTNGDNATWITLSFRTQCVPYTTLPFIENFDNTPGGSPSNGLVPSCWSINVTNPANKPHVSTQSHANSPDFVSAYGALDLYDAPNSTNIAILPSLDLTMQGLTIRNLQVNFSAKVRDINYGTLILGVMDDPTDATTFTPVDTLDYFTRSSTWEEFSIPLISYSGSGTFIAFLWKNAGNFSALIDNLYIDAISECPAPVSVKTDSVVSNTVYFSWVDSVAFSWEAVCMPLGTPLDWSNAVPIYGNSGSITGLAHSTQYNLYLRALCIDYSIPIYTTFKTDCDVITESDLPYRESFDAYGTGSSSTSFPPCWARARTAAPFINSTYSSSFPGAMYTFFNGLPLTMATPEFDVDIFSLQVDFTLRASQTSHGFIVGVMTNPTDDNTFVPVDTVFVKSPNTWEEHTVFLNQYPGNGKYIAFQVNGIGGNGYAIYMDDLVINHIGTCMAPNEITLLDISDDEATITWQERGIATDWEVIYGHAGFNPEDYTGSLIPAATRSITLTSLAANTLYDVYVRSICNISDAGEWSRTPLTFRTTQIPAGLPYTCNFENNTENENWVMANGSQANQWFINMADNNTFGGTKSLYISNSNGITNTYTLGATSYVYAMRAINFSATGLYELEFDWKAQGYESNDLVRAFLVPTTVAIEAGKAYGMESNNTPSGWIDISNGKLNQRATWQHAYSEVNITSTGIYNLVFFWKNSSYLTGSQTPGAIDNVAIRLQSCRRPNELVAFNITGSEASITWDTTSSINCEIQYGQSGFMLGTGTTVPSLGAQSINITGLMDNTTYDVYIRLICSAKDTSTWSAKTIFKTLCIAEITQLPYIENFDNYDNGTPIATSKRDVFPDCWTFLKTTTATDLPYIANWGNQYTHSDFYALDFGYTPNGYSLAIMPDVDSSIAIADLRLTFWCRSNNGNHGMLHIGVMDNPSDTATFTTIGSYDTPAQSYLPYTANMIDYEGTGRYIAFKWENGNGNKLLIDDVELSLNPALTCTPPTSLATSNITENSAMVTWSAGGSESLWSVEYKRASESDYTSAVTSSTSHTLTGLAGNTDYNVRIRAVCYEGSSKGMIINFKTLPSTVVTYTITPSAGANGSINPSSQVIVNEGDDQTFTFTPNQNYLIDSIWVDNVWVGTGNTTYTIRDVQANMTIRVSFKDDLAVSQYKLDNYVAIYPNPASEQLNIKLNAAFEQLEITNLLGQVIYIANVNEQEFTINVSDYRSGVYFIRLISNQGIATKKFVKE